jgi:drug/metabolite transporter superfamily protein YnfA
MFEVFGAFVTTPWMRLGSSVSFPTVIGAGSCALFGMLLVLVAAAIAFALVMALSGHD